MTDKADFIFQMKAFDHQEDHINAEWAYANHTFNPHWGLRTGVMRLLSDCLDLGYAYIGVNRAVDVYGVTIGVNVNGVKISHNFELANTLPFLRTFGGSPLLTGVDSHIKELDVDNFLGVRDGTYWQQWRLGVSYTCGSVSTNFLSDIPQAAFPTNSLKGFMSTGLFYNGEGLTLQTELVQQEIDPPYHDKQDFYSSLAYRLNDIFPYGVYVKMETIDENRDGSLVLSAFYWQESATIGLRYDFYTKMVLKVEPLHIMDKENSDRIDMTNGQGIGDNAVLYALKLDRVF